LTTVHSRRWSAPSQPDGVAQAAGDDAAAAARDVDLVDAGATFLDVHAFVGMLVSEPTPHRSLVSSGLTSRLRVQCPAGLKVVMRRPGAVMRVAPRVRKAITPSVLPT